MQTEKALINDRLGVTKVSWKFRIPTIYNLAVIYLWNMLLTLKLAYFLTVSTVFSVCKQQKNGSITYKLQQLWMWKFQCVLFVLKRLYICYYIICMTVPLRQSLNSFKKMQLYNYQDIIYQYIVYARKKRYFYEMFVFKIRQSLWLAYRSNA